MILNGTLLGSGFTHVPGGSDYVDKSIFSFHYYCWWFGNGNDFNKQTCDRMFGPLVFDQAEEDVRMLGGAAMLTEWGQGCDPANGLIEECNAIMDLADERLMSWASWYFFPHMEVWYVPEENIDVFSRTYAQRIAGTPTSMKYNPETYDFNMCYTPNAQIVQPTEIYASFSRHYPNGVNVAISGEGKESVSFSIDQDANLIRVYNIIPSSEEELTSEVCVTLTPQK